MKPQPYIVDGMTCCAYCGRRATGHIPATPGRVCDIHALEFWTGLLGYVSDLARPHEIVESPCTLQQRIAAIAAAGPAPRHAERMPMRRAS